MSEVKRSKEKQERKRGARDGVEKKREESECSALFLTIFSDDILTCFRKLVSV